ncbi:bifunctional deaminase-reductase-like protein [Caballeronia hypogeia]|uniref:Bifunctional deaminase-reductase-like protein n=1 Tax=Caballeronia hypogeia TaxID=1777140 RepID=A0A158D3N3_9BURK|nr:dihydrofolate reductase family protein [Caballeronia hypogeia]SAK89208.1 bifunctional deaminase-reductase-like protein [Caballeronia hypogeia]
MRKLTVSAFISLDGVIQAPGGPDEDRDGSFAFGGWTVPYADEAIGAHVHGLLSQPFELLLGRRTYDIFASYWPNVPADSHSSAIADKFNAVAKHVATHRGDDLRWHNSHALNGELAGAVRALTHQDGADLVTFGSADMARQLLAAGLIDELCLLTYPVILGRGRRLFDDDARPSAFTLAHSAVTPGGVVIARYVRHGDVRTGSFE